MKGSSSVIVSCAITGSIHTPTMSPYLPVNAEQIAAQSIDAAKAGAAIIHLHARKEEDGRPSQSPEDYMRFLPRISAECDAVLNITTGGGFVATADLKRKGGRSEANYAARIANCSARDGFGLKAYLACRLRIM